MICYITIYDRSKMYYIDVLDVLCSKMYSIVNRYLSEVKKITNPNF